MQGSNDAPFAGNLFRKSSHTTYGRKGRASLATKAGQDSQRQLSPQDMEQKNPDITGRSRMDQASSPEVSGMDRDKALETRNVGGVPPVAADGATSGLKRKVTEEETTAEAVDKDDDAVSGEWSGTVMRNGIPAFLPLQKRKTNDGVSHQKAEALRLCPNQRSQTRPYLSCHQRRIFRNCPRTCQTSKRSGLQKPPRKRRPDVLCSL